MWGFKVGSPISKSGNGQRAPIVAAEKRSIVNRSIKAFGTSWVGPSGQSLDFIRARKAAKAPAEVFGKMHLVSGGGIYERGSVRKNSRYSPSGWCVRALS